MAFLRPWSHPDTCLCSPEIGARPDEGRGGAAVCVDLLFRTIILRKPIHGVLPYPVWLQLVLKSPAMTEFGKTAGVRTVADAGLNGNAPQPPPYDLNPPPYSAVSSHYPSLRQRDETYTSTGYQTNYPASAPYPLYPTYPTAPQLPNAHPQYASYQKSLAASSVVYVPQNTGAAVSSPILPYFVNQQHPSSICVVNQQQHGATYVVNQQQHGATYVVNQQQRGTTYVVNQQQRGATYVVNQQKIAPTYVANQQHPAAQMVLIQSGNAARANHVISGYPTATGRQITIRTGGSGVIIHK
ncbi:uncharacterized protein LOC121275681 isoform X1 [Carcharodon carcharias]|uniref:uncharacterized protein LOC121275681 isoform X1 n=2 Tax=Carcharodon carcharias TaxID=13397 RepID=UPI001B7D9B48|nr:uncharacterized protein LOC121275681 isoform X1 [Carcharodon carcharias]